MPLPHFVNIKSATDNDEVIYKNLYEVNFVIPVALQSTHPTSQLIMLQETTSIKLPTYPELQTVEQRFKYSTRVYLKTPDKTSTTFDVTFNMNQKKTGQVSTFRIIKDWYDLGWNNEDGSLHYKRNMLGDVIVFAHDKEGMVIRKVTYHNVQLTKFSGWEEYDWSSSDIMSLSASFVADYWEDSYM